MEFFLVALVVLGFVDEVVEVALPLGVRFDPADEACLYHLEKRL